VNTGPEYDEPTDPNPTNLAGEPAGGEHPGAPDAEELAADRNLYPEPTSDDVADGTAIPDAEHAAEESSEGHADGDV
jgi:hypothetical protein